MRFTRSDLAGVLIVDVEPRDDERGSFSRTWCVDEFSEAGISDTFAQANLSRNHRRGTLRGMHFTVAPSTESRFVRCTHGAVFDVVADVTVGSPTFGRWVGVELTRHNGRAVFIPQGYAHGFVTLEDDTDVSYLMGEAYRPELQRGVRWDDPQLAIEWPIEPVVISSRDADFALLSASA